MLTVESMEVAVGSGLLETAEGLVDILMIEFKNWEERFDTVVGVCIDIDILNGCLAEYWLVLPNSLKVLLKA